MAIEDINAAIKSNQYPDENVHKLYQRLAKSYEHLQESEKAVNCYAKLESSLTLSKLTKVQKLQIMDESEKSVGLCKTAIIAKDVTDVNKMDKDRSESNFPCYKALHGEIKNASDAIQIKYAPGRGRYLVAARDIEVGECIFHEEAIVNHVKFELSTTHCYNCNKDTRIRLLPCDRCAAVVFCSHECKTESEQSHKYDCPLSIFDLYLTHGSTGVGTTYLMFLAYKVVAQKPRDFFHNLPWKMNYLGSENNTNGHLGISLFSIIGDEDIKTASPVGNETLQRYDIFFNMVTHIESLSTQDMMERLITSLFLLNCLEATHYFDDSKTVSSGLSHLKKEQTNLKERIMFAAYLFHAYSAILSNSFAVSEINASDVSEHQKSGTANRIQRKITGNAVFPTAACMINHSCDPNTSCLYISGKTQVTFATRCIPKGAEITHIYQCHFATTSKNQRQDTLKKVFNFQCRCNACVYNFPMAKDLLKTYSDTASLFIGKSKELDKCFQTIRERMKSTDFNQSYVGKNEKLVKKLKGEVRNIEKTKNLKTLKKILSVLDECNKMISDDIRTNITLKDVENSLQLYFAKQKLASMFLQPPHAIFISSKEAIIDCMLLKYANISYGTPREELLGIYNEYYLKNLL